MSSKRKKRSASLALPEDSWNVEDLIANENNNDHNHNNDAQTQTNDSQTIDNPGKIGERRKSLRLANKKIRLEEKSDKEKQSETQAATTTKSKAATDDLNATDENENHIFNIKGKTELTDNFLSLFDDITADGANSKKFTARCTLCHKNEERRSFRKGNISNLKSHIERVNKKIHNLNQFLYDSAPFIFKQNNNFLSL